MSTFPKDAHPESWHRFFAIESNNKAWTLAEKRTNNENDIELLETANASAWHWQAVGTPLQKMRAKMLLANVYALLGNGEIAFKYASEMHNYFLNKSDTPDWEKAFVHSIYAHAAYVAGEKKLYAQAYKAATESLAAIIDPEDRAIVLKTYTQVPVA